MLIPPVFKNLPFKNINNISQFEHITQVLTYDKNLELHDQLFVTSDLGFNSERICRIRDEQVSGLRPYNIICMVQLNKNLYLCGDLKTHILYTDYTLYTAKQNIHYVLFEKNIYRFGELLFRQYNISEKEIIDLHNRFKQQICKPIKLIYSLGT